MKKEENKEVCTAIPEIKMIKTTSDKMAARVTYGRDYEDICPECGEKFSEHEELKSWLEN